MKDYNLIIYVSIIMGTIARIFMLRIDYRQYPSYPQSFVSHLILGFVAASLGTVATPAFISKEYAAVTFLALATSQFREIRNMERQSLENLEETELVVRGRAYIEDIAKRFEARNYVAFITSFIVCTISIILSNFLESFIVIIINICLGFIVMNFLNNLMKANTIKDIATVKEAKIHFEGPLMCVDNVIIMNIGLNASKEIIEKNAVAVMIYPNNANAVATLANIGQRQAILHNLSTQLGIRKDVDEPDFTPLARRQPETGNIAIVILAINNNIEDMIASTQRVPILESSKRKPIQSANKEG
ncbi:MAG: YIEGIA family protein [Eubacteriaceae bacterium]